ncbi:MAG TPA: Fur family transcriptional regulator [Clostridia bacterium]|nr:Fur family transcriptional regulator [Clostridia bacterium]
MSAEIECIRKMLEEHGISYTHQREEILSLFIVESRHYKPDEVFKLLRCKGIGIATVYRTLEMLRECDIIKEISIGKERFFELKKPESKYIYVHFKCDKCGAFYDYYDIEAAQEYMTAVDTMEEKMNVKVNDVNITVNGLCSKCK